MERGEKRDGGIGERRKSWIYLFIFNNNLERKFVGDVSY